MRILTFLLLLLAPLTAQAFCGFYVAKADADLFNQASKVVMARSEGRTVITMANDFEGAVDEFAMVIPVPVILEETQINVTENRILEHLDAYTAPRLVEYFDRDPCAPDPRVMFEMSAVRTQSSASNAAKALGVTVEAEYTVGEYDIVLLSAKESDGLLVYLNSQGYQIPDGAEDVLHSYIKQDMKFFLAKVNLEAHAKSGYTYLRPLQIAFESEKFMLPIRLGTLNAKGPQDLILYTLTQKGRVETANYRSVKIPSNFDVPLFVEGEFGNFYKDMFATAVDKEHMKAVFLEYAWDMSWCDPCAADPLARKDLMTLGAWWLGDTKKTQQPEGVGRRIPVMPTAALDVFVTRMHVRYTAETFPEDLMLLETSDRQNFQGRYVLRHPFTGRMSCEAGRAYQQSLPQRFEKEAENLHRITRWGMNDIRSKMTNNGQSFIVPKPQPELKWWEEIWQ